MTQREMDLAASIQAVTEEVVLRLTRSIAKETRQREPVPGRRRGAQLRRQRQGAARRRLQGHLDPARGGRRRRRARRGARRLPPAQGQAASRRTATRPHERGAISGRRSAGRHRAAADGGRRAASRCSPTTRSSRRPPQALAEEKALGWFQGRMEFGPRALGGRSILGDARSPTMQSVLNLKVKYRESFRPFAPSVLRERMCRMVRARLRQSRTCCSWPTWSKSPAQGDDAPEQQALFGIDKLNVPRSDIPAVTHVDYSARIQTVHRDTNPRYHALIKAFEALTGCPVIVNTSFNVRGEPIVCTPEDAFRCFMGTEIEALGGGQLLAQEGRPEPALKQNYEQAF